MPTIMDYKGYKARIMKAERLTGDYAHALPPGTPIQVYPVDSFKNPLPNWIKGQGNYVVPVQSDWALWFDWTLNDEWNTAVLPTVKGMNPITGGRTNGLSLERYQNRCPIHGIDFEGVRFCKECGYKWAPQNYIAANNRLWFDGFRTSDGKTRQFFFTEDMEKSIPEKVIGKDDTIPAFGFAFYKTKVHRNSPQIERRDIHHHHYNDWWNYKVGGVYNGYYGNMYSSNKIYMTDNTLEMLSSSGTANFATGANVQNCSSILRGANKTKSIKSEYTEGGSPEVLYCSDVSASVKGMDSKYSQELDVHSPELQSINMNKEVGVGAGAEINQDIVEDILSLSDWQEEPSSIMRIYFIFQDQFKMLKSEGMKDLVGHEEGFMSGLPVG